MIPGESSAPSPWKSPASAPRHYRIRERRIGLSDVLRAENGYNALINIESPGIASPYSFYCISFDSTRHNRAYLGRCIWCRRRRILVRYARCIHSIAAERSHGCIPWNGHFVAPLSSDSWKSHVPALFNVRESINYFYRGKNEYLSDSVSDYRVNLTFVLGNNLQHRWFAVEGTRTVFHELR